MRLLRTFTVGTVAAVLGLTAFGGVAQATPADGAIRQSKQSATESSSTTSLTKSSINRRHQECRYRYRDGHPGWTVTEVKATIECVTHKYGVSTYTALLIANNESGYHAKAENDSSGACGIFQHLPQYWPKRIATVNRTWTQQRRFSDSCFNARSNIYAAVKMAKSSGSWYEGWCKWTTYC